MNIRPATIQDAELVARLNADVQRLHAEALPQFFKPPAGDLPAAAVFASLIANPDNAVWIGDAEGEPVGYLYAQHVSHPDNLFRHAVNMVYVHQLAVRPEHRRKGYGGGLLQAAIAWARSKNATHLELDVWSFNEAARRFFARQGLAVYNERMYLGVSP